MTINLAAFKTQLQDLENKILQNLAESNEDTILDDIQLIKTLEISKVKSQEIKVQLEAATVLEEQITETRNQYRSVSKRGSILYFVIADLAGIDPMYQYSLEFVKKLFNDAILTAKQSKDQEERLQFLIDNITKSIYNNICRGLFE